MYKPRILPTFLCCCLLARPASAESETESIQCLKSATFLAPPESPDHLKYAPDLQVTGLHLALDVTPDFRRRTITGKAILTFKAAHNAVRELRLDAVDLNVQSVTSSLRIQAHQVTKDALIVTFAEEIPLETQSTITVAYSAEPTQGLYFRTPEMGYRDGDAHLFTQGEETSARYWYPCFDSPNVKMTSEVTCRVPAGMTVVSNGRLASSEVDPASGLTAVHWIQEKPHANYLLTLCAGNFKQIEDSQGGIPLAFLTPASEIAEATNSFRHTKDMMEFFDQEIGVPYPWAKYYQVCVNDFVAGGMENTSATTLTDSTLFSSATGNIRNSDGLVGHELAHQWFGDLVTCKDWSHAWLNEGFATYYQLLYSRHSEGQDEFLYGLYQNARQLTSGSDDGTAIVRRNFDQPREIFSNLTYAKAGWVLHMLRAQLGEDLFRRCIKTYLERHQFASVVTEDLRAVVEEMSARSFDQFFDQWFYHGHFPELEIAYSWDELAKLAKVTVRQTQKLSENVLLFNFPLTIAFYSGSGVTNPQVTISAPAQDFYFPLQSAPRIVRIDPDLTLLARIGFQVPGPMLAAQLTNANDVVGRLLAIEQLASRRDKDSVAKLRNALDTDPYYGVRLEAAGALRGIHSDDALAALLSSTNQPDARVRLRIAQDIGGFYDPKAREYFERVIAQDQNPAILAVSIERLGEFAGPQTQATLIRFLDSESFRNELAVAAIAAIRSQDDPAYITPLQQTLLQREGRFTSFGFSSGLRTLAYLARNETNKDGVREFLMGHVNHKKRGVRLAAMGALATLGDPKAIAVLETFASASKETPERPVAEKAVADLRAGRKPVDDFKNLRQELLDLQKANRDLRKELDDLEKKTQAREAAKSEPQPKKKTDKKQR